MTLGWLDQGRFVAAISLGLSALVIALCVTALPLLHRKLAAINGDLQREMYQFKELSDSTWEAILELRALSGSRPIRSASSNQNTYQAPEGDHLPNGQSPSRDLGSFSKYTGPKLSILSGQGMDNINRVPNAIGGGGYGNNDRKSDNGGAAGSYQNVAQSEPSVASGYSRTGATNANSYSTQIQRPSISQYGGKIGMGSGYQGSSGGGGNGQIGGGVPGKSCDCPPLTCPPGPPGEQGLAGQDGTPGPEGRPGQDGVPGQNADAESLGNQCFTCPPGPPGDAGAPGRPGGSGKQGKQGWPGPRGNIGTMGEQGMRGPLGPQGTAGSDGKTGPDGKDGLGGKGMPGKPGNKGPDGAPGPQGNAGKPSSDFGKSGPQGAPGMRGDDGRDGSAGNKGPSGPVGSSGKDAHYCECKDILNKPQPTESAVIAPVPTSLIEGAKTIISKNVTDLPENVTVSESENVTLNESKNVPVNVTENPFKPTEGEMVTEDDTDGNAIPDPKMKGNKGGGKGGKGKGGGKGKKGGGSKGSKNSKENTDNNLARSRKVIKATNLIDASADEIDISINSSSHFEIFNGTEIFEQSDEILAVNANNITENSTEISELFDISLANQTIDGTLLVEDIMDVSGNFSMLEVHVNETIGNSTETASEEGFGFQNKTADSLNRAKKLLSELNEELNRRGRGKKSRRPLKVKVLVN